MTSEVKRKAWLINGNSGIDDTVQFIGTTDLNDFIIKTNNIIRQTIKSNGETQIKKALIYEDKFNVGKMDLMAM